VSNFGSLKSRKFLLGDTQFLRVQLPSLGKIWTPCCLNDVRNTMKRVRPALAIITNGRELRKKRANRWGNPEHSSGEQNSS
jgi:hypothetical protein